MANIGEEFGAIPVKDEDIGAEFGAVRVTEPTVEPRPRPVEAAQASISKAFGAPAEEEPGVVSRLASEAGGFLARQAAGLGAGAVAGVPFGVGPSVVGALSPLRTTEDVEREMAEAREAAPIAYGIGEFGAELPSFLTGAGLGQKLATKVGPKLTPSLRRAGEALLRGVGLGGVTGAEAAGRAAVEGAPAGEALKTGAETAGAMALLPGAFEAAPALASKVPGVVGRAAQVVAPAVAPATLAATSMPEKGADLADWTKWLLAQGQMAKDIGGAGFEKLAAKSRESIQPKLRRAAAEGTELAREDIYKDVRADEAIRNQQFRAALKGEQRAMRTAEKIKQGDVTEVNKLAQDALDLDALVKGLGEGTDPSLRGLLGKLFQDASNRLLRAKQALENRPELASKDLVEKINTVDRLITESYLKNTEKGGYLEDFNDDPYARLEVERQARLKQATEKRDRVAQQQAELLTRIGTRNYLEEARTKQRPPTVPEPVARELAAKAGLEYAGPDEQFGKPVRHRLALSPERQAELEAQTQAEFERQVKAGGRSLQGLAPEAEYGEKPPFFDPMSPTRLRAATQPMLPDWMQPSVAGRIIAGPVRALTQVPQSEFRETQRVETAKRPTEDVMARPFNTVAMLRAWDKVLERPSDVTKGALARIADRMGVTYDRLLKNTAYRAAALEQALKDPEVAKEVMANVQAP